MLWELLWMLWGLQWMLWGLLWMLWELLRMLWELLRMLWELLWMLWSAPALAYRQDLKRIQMKMTKLSLHARMRMQHHQMYLGTVGIFALGHPSVFGGAALLTSCAGQGRIMGLDCSRIKAAILCLAVGFSRSHTTNTGRMIPSSNRTIVTVHRSMQTSSAT